MNFIKVVAKTQDLERVISGLSIRSALVGTVIIVVLVVLGALVRNRAPKLKLPIFLLIAGTVLAVTFILAGSTVYLNQRSLAGGPVHWHADFEIWTCGKQLELRDPTGLLSNKVGTSTLHEHNDKRIHLEGVPVENHDASLGKFFDVIGGQITQSNLLVPLNDGQTAYFEDGQECQNGQPAKVQVFAYSLTNEEANGKKLYRQNKIDDPAGYLYGRQSQVPPGDCIIIEFEPSRDRSDHKCLQYQVEDERGNYQEVY